MRNKSPARLCTLRMPLHRTRPPLMSLSGHKASQDTKCAAVGHRDMSRPTSLNNINTIAINPGICVRSTPNNEEERIATQDRQLLGSIGANIVRLLQAREEALIVLGKSVGFGQDVVLSIEEIPMPP